MCAGSGGSVSRDNVRFLVIGKAVWEPPQAREWAPDYVSVDALLVELLAKIVGQRSQVRFLLTGFPKGSNK